MQTLATNFFSIELSKNNLSLDYFDFESKENLIQLRVSNPDLFIINSKKKLLYWSKNATNSANTLKIDTNDDHNTVSNIFSESLLRQFKEDKKAFSVKQHFHTYRITLLNNDISNNNFEGLKLYQVISIHFTSLFIAGNIKKGFTISSSIKPYIIWKREDFINNNIPIDKIQFHENTGEAINNSTSIFSIANHFRYTTNLKKKLEALGAIQNEFSVINEFVKTFFENKLNDFVLPNNLRITNISNIHSALNTTTGSLINYNIKKPENYFYRGKYYQAETSIKRKIAFNKPFTYDEFENKQIVINIILPESVHADTLNFFNYVKKELIETFCIKESQIQAVGKKIDDFSLKSYQKTLNKIESVDLVLVVIDESHKLLNTNESPYYFCKSEFIKRGINTQEVQIQQIKKFLLDKKSGIVNYTDHNIALNIYAKLGGMAWTIKPNNTKNELVIGIGATIDKKGQPILGLTSVFRGDGKYLLGKVASVTSMENYQTFLEKSITEIISQNIANGVLDKKQDFLLIFHIFKPAGKDNEIKALKNIISKFVDYRFNYTFVHIGDGHNYCFFSYEHTSSQFVFKKKNDLGLNDRGTFVKIHNKQGFLGLNPTSSKFLKIDIHKDSTFVDLEYIATQIYEFAELSHTSYNKSGKPVTIKYANLMAYFAEKLKEIPGFYLEEIEMSDNSLWFI